MIRATIFNEFRHEREHDEVRALYPDGMHAVIGKALAAQSDIDVKIATMDMPENGLPQQVLDDTDVLFWWAHCYQQYVLDEVVERVVNRVLDGMGLVVLHSAHGSKVFQRLMGTRTGVLRWRESADLQRVWVTAPGHPITAGLGEYFEIPHDETYGEPFGIPQPDEQVFVSWFSGGEVFRSGCCYRRGAGRIFYFQPGHETYPVYYQKEVQQVLINAARWAAPLGEPCVRKRADMTPPFTS